MVGERMKAMRLILRAMRLVAVGSVHVVPYGREVEAGFRITWPPAREEKRVRVRQLAALLGTVEGFASVWVVPQGVRPDQGDRFAWPALPVEERDRKGPAVAGYVAPEEAAPPVVEVTPTHSESTAVSTVAEASAPPVTVQAFRIIELEDARNLVSEACARDIIALLEGSERRMTLTEMCDEFSARGIEWSHSTVSHTAPGMRRDGRLTNVSVRDGRGRGYGLPEWDAG